eukprot:2229329-Amphidinium_carterae.1
MASLSLLPTEAELEAITSDDDDDDDDGGGGGGGDDDDDDEEEPHSCTPSGVKRKEDPDLVLPHDIPKRIKKTSKEMQNKNKL